jgi:hypothetical protein
MDSIVCDTTVTTSVPCSLRHDASHIDFGGPEPFVPSKNVTPPRRWSLWLDFGGVFSTVVMDRACAKRVILTFLLHGLCSLRCQDKWHASSIYIYIYVIIIIRGSTGSDEPWPAEQPPLAVFPHCTRRYWVDMWSAHRIPQLHFQLSKRDRYFFIQVTTQFIRSRGWVDPVPDPTPSEKS